MKVRLFHQTETGRQHVVLDDGPDHTIYLSGHATAAEAIEAAKRWLDEVWKGVEDLQQQETAR